MMQNQPPIRKVRCAIPSSSTLLHSLRVIVVIAILLPSKSAATTQLNHLPQPWRQQAVVSGADEIANVERYLHELTFDHSQTVPSAVDNGIRGAAGSVSSRRLYLDFRFRQDFGFNEDQQGFLLDIQRSEDFDGTYDRQLIGFRHQLTGATEVWLQGDVSADKSRSDVYFSSRRTFDNGSWLHGSWIFPDLYFNAKTRSDDGFVDPAQSVFVQWHQPGGQSQTGTTASITYSPPATFNSREQSLVVESESVRGALSHRRRLGHWQLRAGLSGEYTRRNYNLDEQADSIPTRRDHLRIEATAVYSNHRLQPGIGLHYFYLREEGYTGRNLDEFVDLLRREPTVSGQFRLPLTNAVTLRPAIYLSAPKIRQFYSESGDRTHKGFTGKLALPFEVVLSGKENATLTLAPTFYLHKPAFGGGNLQLHWPM